MYCETKNKFIITLPWKYDDCPKYWQNFVSEYNPTGDPSRLHRALKDDYHAVLDDESGDLTFDNESDYIMFRLRW